MENLNKDYIAWQGEVGYVTQHQDGLRRTYGEGVIAVKGGEVIASGSDKFKLAKEMARKHPSEVILISTIENIVNPREFFLDSPEVCE